MKLSNAGKKKLVDLLRAKVDTIISGVYDEEIHDGDDLTLCVHLTVFIEEGSNPDDPELKVVEERIEDKGRLH